jgi:predicted DCC family thiol-disulfide oxidoreductase YuxK
MWAQHPTSQECLAEFGISFENVMSSIVVFRNGKVYRGSDAFIQVLLTMPWYMRVLAVLIAVFPRLIREWVYTGIASNRYLLFGKKDSCSLPSPTLKSKFLHPV